MKADLSQLQRDIDVARKRVHEIADRGDFTVEGFMCAAKKELVELNVAKVRYDYAQSSR